MDTEKLYHYTNAPALVNILNHGYLRATQAWHLADGSECRHAIDTLRMLAPELSRNNGLWRSLETTLLSMPRYVVCFSKVRNGPHQWEHYGSNGAGACIVYDPKKARSAFLNSSWDRFKCQYDPTVQQSMLKELAENLRNRGETAIVDRMCEFWKWNIQFKSEDYAQENEVRYVLTPLPRVEQVIAPPPPPEAAQLMCQCALELNSYTHQSGMFDEKYRPCEPFCIQESITEIILGSRFTATKNYCDHLSRKYTVTQI